MSGITNNISGNLKKLVGKYQYFSINYVFDNARKKETLVKFNKILPIKRELAIASKNAAVLIPICIVDNEVSLLYTLRAPNLTTHRGQVSFPGGMRDKSDSSLEETALRETEEELGIDKKNIRPWGIGQPAVAKGGTYVTPVIGQINSHLHLNELKINEKEVSKVFTVPLRILCDPTNLAYTQFKGTFSMPIFLGGPIRIWGLTATFTHMFLQSLYPTDVYNNPIKFIIR